MRKGEPVEGLAFYRLLYDDDAFCAELGRATLAAQRLESALKQFLRSNALEVDMARATLGRLIRFAESKKLLTQMVPPLKMLLAQRNYLTHNVHALFLGLVEETILERGGCWTLTLIPSLKGPGNLKKISMGSRK